MKNWLKVLWFLLMGFYSSYAQNPFDIKTPGKKEEKKTQTVNQPVTKPDQPKAITPTQTIEAKPVAPVSNQPPAGSPSSANPFEIKPGGPPRELINQKGAESTNQANSIAEPKKPDPKLSAGKNQDNGNNAGQVNEEAANKQSTEVTGTSSANIQKQIDEFKSNSTKAGGNINKNMWFAIYIFLFLLAAVAINFNRAYPVALIKSTYNQNQLRILFKDAFKGNHTFIFGILYFIFIVNAGIFLYFSFQIFNLSEISLFQAIVIVFTVYLVRHLILFVMGVIFPMTKESNLFSYTIGIYNMTLGLALMLINILLSFVDVETGKMLIFSGLSIVFVLYTMRQVRGLLNNLPAIVSSKFHFIIYLCTVEIAPWLLLTGILLR